jgi:hypothetical protein
MKNDTSTKEYIQKLESLKLSESSRARMQNSLLEYARFHGVSEDVRAGEDARSIEQVPVSTSLFSLKRMYMPFVILLAVMVGGGTSYAAQDAVPGDFLYAIKTEVNEPVRSALALSANAEADLQADIIAERIEEAETLKAEGRLEGEVAAQLAADIQTHIAKAAKANETSDAEVRSRTTSELDLALTRFDVLVENDTALAVRGIAEDESVSTSAALGTMLAIDEMDAEAFRLNTQARVDSLMELVEENQSQLSAEVYISLSNKLDEADALLVQAESQAEVQSRNSIDRAAVLAGEVESKLTTLGSVRLDMNSGAIIDIDFSNAPVLDINLGADAQVDSDDSRKESDSTTEAEAGVQLDSRIDLDLEAVDVEIDGAVRSGLKL